MEKIIGIFDEQINYAERFKNYINTKKEIGCFAVVFGQEKELLDFLEKTLNIYIEKQTAERFSPPPFRFT